VRPNQVHPPTHVSYQLGIDLDMYWNRHANVAHDVAIDARYARSLGANAVMISFPLYTNGRVPSAGSATPPPRALAEAVSAARAQGLQVGVRPLLDEKNLPRSRPWFLPRNVDEWLTAYSRLLLPYARAMQEAGADRFWIGTELTLFAHAKDWTLVSRRIRGVFKGNLYFAANWVTQKDAALLPGSGAPGVTISADAYPLMPVPVAKLRSEWAVRSRLLPRGTVLSEIGIAAKKGAQAKPYAWKPSKGPIDPGLQASWFTAACDAVQIDALGGIYFWVVNIGQSLTARPTWKTANQFTASPGATAIKACFKRLRASSR
jgi:hypothetical protein